MNAPFQVPDKDDPDHWENWAADEPLCPYSTSTQRKMQTYHGGLDEKELIDAVADRLVAVTSWDDTPSFVKDPLWNDDEWTNAERLQAIVKWLRAHGGYRTSHSDLLFEYDGGNTNFFNLGPALQRTKRLVALERIICFLQSHEPWSQEIWPALANLGSLGRSAHKLPRDELEPILAAYPGHADGLADLTRLRL